MDQPLAFQHLGHGFQLQITPRRQAGLAPPPIVPAPAILGRRAELVAHQLLDAHAGFADSGAEPIAPVALLDVFAQART